MHQLPATIEGDQHLVEGRFGFVRLGVGRQRAPLGKGGGIRGHLALQLGDRFGDPGRSHQGAQPPSGHGKGLGEPGNDDRAFAGLCGK